MICFYQDIYYTKGKEIEFWVNENKKEIFKMLHPKTKAVTICVILLRPDHPKSCIFENINIMIK